MSDEIKALKKELTRVRQQKRNAVAAVNAVGNFKEELKTIPTDELKTLKFATNSFSKMPHQLLASDRIDQHSLDADLLIWLIQGELGSRKTKTELPYSHGELYLALGIPKEFLD